MNTQNIKNENRRLFDRIEADGIFIHGGETYKIQDISVGGIQLDRKINVDNGSKIISGKVGLSQSSVRLYSDVICELIENVDVHGARLKFIEISEEFTEFLRGLALRHKVPTSHKVAWLGSDSYQIDADDDTNVEKSILAKLFRVEILVGIVILALAAILLIRASSQQNFWVVARHDIVAPVSGEIDWLHPDSIVSVGDEIARLKVDTLISQQAPLSIKSKIRGQTLNWNFNAGDRVTEGDIVGVINLIPSDDTGIKAIIGFQSPLLSLQPNKYLKVSTATHRSMNARVSYAIAPTQASALTGISSDSFRFQEYYIISILAPEDASLSGQPQVDILGTLLSYVFQTD